LASLTPIDPDSEEFKKKYAPYVADVIEVVSADKIKVKYRGNVEIVQMNSIGSIDIVRQAKEAKRDYPQFSTREMETYLKHLPAMRNHLAVRLPKGSQILLKFGDSTRNKAGHLVAKVSRLDKWPPNGHVTFWGLNNLLLLHGFAVIPKEKWNQPRLSVSDYKDRDLSDFNSAKSRKRGIWSNGTKGLSIHISVSLPTDVPSALIVPLEPFYFRARKSPDVKIKYTPMAALTLICEDQRSVEAVIDNWKWINQQLKTYLKNKTNAELVKSDIRSKIEADITAVLTKNWPKASAKPKLKRVSLRELLVTPTK